MERNSLSKEDAEQRINSQMPLVEKCNKATHVIDNSAELDYTRKQVGIIYKNLSNSKLHWRVRIILSLGFLSLFGVFRFLVKFLW